MSAGGGWGFSAGSACRPCSALLVLSSRGLQVSSEISFLISARKVLPTSGKTIDVTFDPKFFASKFVPLPLDTYMVLNIVKQQN